MNILEPTRQFKYGDIREDGYVFLGYQKKILKKSGDTVFHAKWISPEALKRQKSKRAEYDRRSYLKHSDKRRAKTARWRAENPERKKEYKNEYNRLNKEKHHTWVTTWRKKNPERVAQYNRITYLRNKEAVFERGARRRALKLQTATSLTHDEKLISRAIYASAKRISECLGIPHEVDHIVPLSKQGAHHPSNLQILPRFLNRSKGAKLILV